MPKIGNWTTEAKLAAMRANGWTERERRELPDEGRTLVRLHLAADRVETYRSLPLAAPAAQVALF